MIQDTTNDRSPAAEPVEPGETPVQAEVEREGFSLGRSLRNPRTLISFGLAIAIILFVFRGFNIDLAKTWTYMSGANWALLAIGLVVFYITFPLRAFRWRVLLENAEVP